MMRVSMLGYYTLDAFSAAAPRLMRELAANGVQGLAAVNLYFTPTGKGAPKVIFGPNGEPLEHLYFDPEGPDHHRPRRGGAREASPFPVRHRLDDAYSTWANWKGGDLGYLKGKWDVSYQELAVLLAVPVERVLSLLRSPASTLSGEEKLRLGILQQINSWLVDIIHPLSVSQWLRRGEPMSALEGSSPLEQMITFDIAAIDRLYRSLRYYRHGKSLGLQLDGLPPGYDWVIDVLED